MGCRRMLPPPLTLLKSLCRMEASKFTGPPRRDRVSAGRNKDEGEIHSVRDRTRPRLQRAGFTLIELMVVTLVVGVLAAIMIPRVDSFSQRAHYPSIVQDFRHLSASQERHFQLNLEYAIDLADLDFSTSPGVDIEVSEASVQGWAGKWRELGPPFARISRRPWGGQC